MRYLKKFLAHSKWAIIHFPFTLIYRITVWLKLPIEIQAKWLPPPLRPPIYWTSIDQINIQASLEYPPYGRWIHVDDWDLKITHPLPSIHKKVSKREKKWEVHQTVRKLFLFKKKYKKTPQYRDMIYLIKNGEIGLAQNCKNEEDVAQYFKRLKKAYKSMKKRGYLTQKQLGNPDLNEIRIHITRKGKLCLGTGGNHRIRMAEILNIKDVPFLLKGIHQKWIVKLSNEYSLPPHKAVTKWLNLRFSKAKPNIYKTDYHTTMKNSNNNRIMFYIGSLLAGGKERRLLELLTFLKNKTDIELMLVMTIKKIHFPQFLELGIPVKILNPEGNGFQPNILPKFYQLCKEFKPDVIHTWGAKQTLYTLPAVIGLKIPLINSQIASAPPKGSISFMDNLINKINFQFSKLILSNSYAGIDAYNPPKNKCKVIYNGVSCSRFTNLPDRDTVRAKYQVYTPYLVIMSASFSANKNHKIFLEIAKIVTSIREDITFIGVGAHDYSVNPLYSEILEASIDYPRIIYPGRIEDVEDLVNASDIGMLFSNTSVHGEGISNSVLEYMALSKPVIANDAGGTKELVFNNKNGYLITNQSAEEISKMVIELIDNKEKSKRFGDFGRKVIEKNFSIDKMGKGFIKIYEECIGSKIALSKKDNTSRTVFNKSEYIQSNS